MALDVRQIVSDTIKTQIEAGTPPWRKGLVNGLARNPATGTVFKPLNQFQLAMEGKSDPRWFTPRYLMDNKLSFKGAKCGQIAMFFDGKAKDKSTAEDVQVAAGSDGDTQEKKGGFINFKLMNMVNAEDVTGLPSLSEYLGTPEFEAIELIDELARQMMATGLKIQYGGNTPCYMPNSDTIRMPRKELFLSPMDFYAALLHEMGHATGHPTRCDRKLTGRYGSEDYAFEELVAEQCAAMSLALFHAEPSPTALTNHSAYLASWCRIIDADKGALFTASKLAFEASDWLAALLPEAHLHAKKEAAMLEAVVPVVKVAKPKRRLAPSF